MPPYTESGAHLVFNLIGKNISSYPMILSLLKRCEISLDCISVRQKMQWSCVLTKRAKFRPSTEPNRCFLWGWDMLRVSHTTMSGMEPQRCLLRSMSQLVDATTRSVHDIIHELRPLLLDDLGLPEAIDWQVSEFRRRSGIALELDGVLDDFDLDPDKVTAVFRLLQEMLTNVARHSGAKRCQVRIRRRGNVVYLSVRDDGTGIPADRAADPGSFGLLGMRERARTLGGRFRIRGVPGKGTIVAVTIHVRAAAGSQESEGGPQDAG